MVNIDFAVFLGLSHSEYRKLVAEGEDNEED